jgi:hypothetical protein
MSLSEKLKDFAGAIALATSHAPDEYDKWCGWTYESHMTDLKELWSYIRPRAVQDLELADEIHANLQRMFGAFETGNKAEGRAAAWDIYNSNFRKLQ